MTVTLLMSCTLSKGAMHGRCVYLTNLEKQVLRVKMVLLGLIHLQANTLWPYLQA